MKRINLTYLRALKCVDFLTKNSILTKKSISTERLTTLLAFQDITSNVHKAVVIQTEIAHELSIEPVRSAIPGPGSIQEKNLESLSAPSGTPASPLRQPPESPEVSGMTGSTRYSPARAKCPSSRGPDL